MGDLTEAQRKVLLVLVFIPLEELELDARTPFVITCITRWLEQKAKEKINAEDNGITGG